MINIISAMLIALMLAHSYGSGADKKTKLIMAACMAVNVPFIVAHIAGQP